MEDLISANKLWLAKRNRERVSEICSLHDKNLADIEEALAEYMEGMYDNS